MDGATHPARSLPVSSVASDPTIFAPAKAQNPGRSGAAPDRSGNNGDFAKLLDDEPAREPVARSKRNEAKAPRRDDTAPARDASRSDGSAEPASPDRSATKTADTDEQTSAVAKDAGKDAARNVTDAGKQSADEETETEVTAAVLPFALPVVEAPAVTTPTVVAAPAAPAPTNLLPETAPVTSPTAPQGEGVPAAPPVATPASGASAGAAEGAATGGTTAAVAPVAPGAMKAQQQAAANIETSESKPLDVAQTKPATASALTETPARAEPEAELPVRPAPERAAATPGQSATDSSVRPNDSAAIAKTGAELAQSLGITAPAQHAAPAQSTAAAHAAAAAAPAQAPAVPVANVAFEIAAQSLAGKNRFEIRLDPPELGRIDVRLEIDNEGHVKSRLIVERAETLDMLRRDAPQLERALQQAGLKTSDNALEFSLRDQTQHRDNEDNGNGRRVGIADDTLPATDTVQHNYGRLLGLGGGLDIRV